AVSSTLTITSDDLAHPKISLSLTGAGINLAPCVYALQPSQVNFGLVQLLHQQTQGVQIRNLGTEECVVNDVEIDSVSSPAFGLPNGKESCVHVRPGDSHTIPVSYTPSLETIDTGKLDFYISDPTSPNVAVDMRGTGVSSALLV